jgi:hypothetical protein
MGLVLRRAIILGAVETCTCGTFVIGKCAECGAYVCGETTCSTMVVSRSGANPRRLCRTCHATHEAQASIKLAAFNARHQAEYSRQQLIDRELVASFASVMADEGQTGPVSFHWVDEPLFFRPDYYADPTPCKKGWMVAGMGRPYNLPGLWALTTDSEIWSVSQAPITPAPRERWWHRPPPPGPNVLTLLEQHHFLSESDTFSIAMQIRRREFITAYPKPPPYVETWEL